MWSFELHKNRPLYQPLRQNMCREGQSPGLVADPLLLWSVSVGGWQHPPSGQEASRLSASGCLSPGATNEQRMVFFMVESVDGSSWLGGGRKPRHTVLPFSRGLGHRCGMDPSPGVQPWVQAVGMRVEWHCPPRGLSEHTWAGCQPPVLPTALYPPGVLKTPTKLSPESLSFFSFRNQRQGTEVACSEGSAEEIPKGKP